jgi:hypothetical protein
MAEFGTTAMALASALATGGRNLGAMKTSRFCLIIIIVRKVSFHCLSVIKLNVFPHIGKAECFC